MYDLDEAFSSDRLQVKSIHIYISFIFTFNDIKNPFLQFTQLSNKCIASAEESKTPIEERELEYFIIECGRILKVFNEAQTMNAKEVLHTMCTKIAQYKKLDRDD